MTTTYIDEREARMLLSHIVEPGDEGVGRLIATEGVDTAIEILCDVSLDVLSDEHRALAARVRPRVRPSLNREIVASTWRNGIRFIMPGDDEWPRGMDDLHHLAPIGLWVRGQRLESQSSVSIVGARAATSYGEHTAHEFASSLAGKGYGVVSGGAYGIDAAAHRGALVAGGTTIAYLAGGVDRMYPAGHQQLAERIVQSGALISEVPPGGTPTKWRFLARNRLIAAHSLGTLVVEAGYRSGSLYTADQARQLGRHVMAVPGPITSVASAGCHRLISAHGARLVTSVDDVIEAVA